MSSEAGHARRLVRNTLINAGSSIFVTAYAFFLTPILLEELGPSDYGAWLLALTFTLTQGYLPILDLGLGQASLRRMAAAIGENDIALYQTVFRHLFAIYSLLGAGAGLAIVALSHTLLNLFSLDHDLDAIFIWIAVQVFFEFVTAALTLALEARASYGRVRTAEVSGRIALGLSIVLLLGSGHGVVAIAGASAASSSLVFGISAIMFGLSTPRMSERGTGLNSRMLRTLLVDGRWFGISRFFSVIYAQMDRLIVGLVVSTVAVSHYEVAYKIQALAALVLTVIPSAVFPATAQIASSGDRRKLKALFVRGTRYAVGFSVPACASLLYFTTPLIRSWLSSDYLFMVGDTRLFVSWTLLASFHTIASIMLAGLGRSKTSFILASSSVVANLCLSLALAPSFGIRGVIIGTLVGYMVVFPVYLTIESRLFDLSIAEWSRDILRPLALPLVAQFVFSVPLILAFDSTESLLLTGMLLGISTLVGWTTFLALSLSRDERVQLRSALISR